MAERERKVRGVRLLEKLWHAPVIPVIVRSVLIACRFNPTRIPMGAYRFCAVMVASAGPHGWWD